MQDEKNCLKLFCHFIFPWGPKVLSQIWTIFRVPKRKRCVIVADIFNFYWFLFKFKFNFMWNIIQQNESFLARYSLMKQSWISTGTPVLLNFDKNAGLTLRMTLWRVHYVWYFSVWFIIAPIKFTWGINFKMLVNKGNTLIDTRVWPKVLTAYAFQYSKCHP